MNILVVDDDEAACELMSLRLEGQGFNVLPAADALWALAMLEHETVDAVVTDLRMPHLDGGELSAHLRGDARFRDLPIFVLSAFATDAESEQVLRQGASMMLPKEMPVEQLATLMRFAV
jgi:CheY-like chemotaxis protein